MDIGPIHIKDDQLQELHETGLAQEFDVAGSSDTTTRSFPLGDEQAAGGDSAPSPDGRREERAGARSDPGRDRGR